MGIGISERNRMAGGFGFCAGRTASVENGVYHMVLQKYQGSGLPQLASLVAVFRRTS